jgi:hypothetical protein
MKQKPPGDKRKAGTGRGMGIESMVEVIGVQSDDVFGLRLALNMIQ